MRDADVSKIEMWVADEPVPAFARIVSRQTVERESKIWLKDSTTSCLSKCLLQKVQARALGRIISSRTIPALKKNVTQHMYGGDRTRKNETLGKTKRGEKRMKAEGTVDIPHDVFLKWFSLNSLESKNRSFCKEQHHT